MEMEKTVVTNNGVTTTTLKSGNFESVTTVSNRSTTDYTVFNKPQKLFGQMCGGFYIKH